MNVHTRPISDLEPQKRPGMGRDWGMSSINTVSSKHLKDGPDDIFYAQGSGYGVSALSSKTEKAGVDPHLMDGLGFRPRSNPGGKLGSVWIWVSHDNKHALTNRGMQELAAHVAVGAHTAPKPGAPNEGVMSEASRLVESVLQGASPRGVITRALEEDTGKWSEVLLGKDCRVRVADHPANRIQIEELPGKPVKRKVRVWTVDYLTNHVVWYHDYEGYRFLSANLLHNAQFHASMTYDQAKAAFQKAIDDAIEAVQKKLPSGTGKPHLDKVVAIHPHEDTQSFLEVEPHDYEPIVAKGKDFTCKSKWDSFSAYSPNSDLQNHDPHYTVWNEKSPGGARTLFKTLKADPNALRNIPWDKFGDWLREGGVAAEMHFSQWH